MSITPSKMNTFMMFNLPSAYISGVRLKKLTDKEAIVTVKHTWISKNPFKSLYFAVQSMASELSTGALVIKKIKESGKPISMLVTQHSGTFTKKATGVITFSCFDGALLDDAISNTIATGEGQVVKMKSVGKNEDGIQVSAYEYEWSIKLKTKK